MGYRNIIISSPAKLSVKRSSLIIKTEEEHAVPLEDINALMLESTQISLSSYLLSALSENGICTFVCDQKHLPCAILLPFKSFSRKPKMLRLQLEAKKPFIKQIWQQIIVQKILNQAKVLSILNLEGSSEIEALSRRVKSGDSENAEAVAAAKYFRLLFGTDFIRGSDSGVNAALNYGYAIIRGHICRSLVVHGLEPELGIFHDSQLNTFNLADDFIEPFRPLVDLFVATHATVFEQELSTTGKHKLFNLINMSMLSGGQKHAVHYAVERTVQSYATALKDGQAQLLLAEVLPLSMHEYE